MYEATLRGLLVNIYKKATKINISLDTANK